MSCITIKQYKNEKNIRTHPKVAKKLVSIDYTEEK